MISKNNDHTSAIQMVSIDQLVPEDHLLRKIDAAIDFNFIYDLVEDKYSADTGRPSIDPVTLIKIPIIQYMFGIKSMRQTIKDIEVNVAYRWFLGLDFFDKVPHFTTFGKNYKRRFEGTDLFEQIFTEILLQCMKHGVVDTKTLFVDSTHVKAAANKKKFKKVLVAKKAARFYDEQLKDEINADRELHGKKPLKDREEHSDDDNDSSDSSDSQGESNSSDTTQDKKLKEKKESTIDPESGWFHKGEHKEVFAYSIETACDKNGWILDYTVHPGNEHDSTTFPKLYERLKKLEPSTIVSDAGYKIPAIAKLLIDDGVTPIMPYTRTHTKKGMFRHNEFVYDEFYDCYLCPNNEVLKYSTTNRDGYREYKSPKKVCKSCPDLGKCTQSKECQKIVTRHIWSNYIDQVEEIRLTEDGKKLYALRKETIERCFGTAKEHHSMRYTQQVGKEKMSMKVGLTFACMNMKKLARLLEFRNKRNGNSTNPFDIFKHFQKMQLSF